MVIPVKITQHYSVGYVSALDQIVATANISGQTLENQSSYGFVWGQTSVANAEYGIYNIDSQLLSFAGSGISSTFNSGRIDAISIILDGGANTYFMSGQYYGIPDVDENDTRMFSGLTIGDLNFSLSDSGNRAIIIAALLGNYDPLRAFIMNRPYDYTGSSGNDLFTGGNLPDLANAGGGDDILNGGLGADRMYGGTGNDRYFVDNAGDRAIEALNAGYDTVSSAISYSLSGTYVEHLWLSGSGNINGAGNSQANRLTGNVGNNVLNAGAGNDVLVGNAGNDTLIGGTGVDTLTGGAGNDAFRFEVAPSSANADVVTDFNVPADTFQLENGVMAGLGATTGVLAATKFHASATGLATTSAQRVLYDTDDGRLYYDADGSGAAARILLATVTKNLALTHADFVVI